MKSEKCFVALRFNILTRVKNNKETDLSDLSDSWRDTYYANFQINQINPLPFNLSNLRLENLLSPSKKNEKCFAALRFNILTRVKNNKETDLSDSWRSII